ncbi:four helix bundle protein [Bacillus sp. HNG]|uniref:four helix bundle protein n=1 Tax=Bacillus sp. HNG TaxID=2293325 RepID=UPI000E2F0B34|nr:four helix bundle protein [Bacillus sp. HNG]RFB12732.1 four helix bundle protein [Bacillus sp. HNG]
MNEAIGSINEVCAFLELASLRGFLPFEVSRRLRVKAVELLKMTIGLVKRNQSTVGVKGENFKVDDYSKSHLYQRSTDLMQSIYLLVDDVDLEISDKDW